VADPTIIVVATFDEESKTFQAFSEIKHLAATRKVNLEAMVIVRRTANGGMETPEVLSTGQRGAFAGGLIGSLIGIMGGPLGVLLGWGTGALLGSLRDLNEVRSDISLVQRLSEGMNPGNVALMGEFSDDSVREVGNVVRRLGGEFLQRPAAEIEEEIRQANEANEAASNEARKRFGVRGERDKVDDITS
jgi:uncharacterized membrane protein